jgi:hypothetical protein
MNLKGKALYWVTNPQIISMEQSIEELSAQIEGIKKVVFAIERYAESQDHLNEAADERFNRIENAITTVLTSMTQITEHLHTMAADIEGIKAKLSI